MGRAVAGFLHRFDKGVVYLNRAGLHSQSQNVRNVKVIEKTASGISITSVLSLNLVEAIWQPTAQILTLVCVLHAQRAEHLSLDLIRLVKVNLIRTPEVCKPSRYHLPLSVASQAGEQPRIPPLRTIVADGNPQRLLLPDEHEQPLSPRDPRIDEVSLQQHVVLRGERDHDCRKLRPLRLVDGDRIGERYFVQFAEVVLNDPVVEADSNLL